MWQILSKLLQMIRRVAADMILIGILLGTFALVPATFILFVLYQILRIYKQMHHGTKEKNSRSKARHRRTP